MNTVDFDELERRLLSRTQCPSNASLRSCRHRQYLQHRIVPVDDIPAVPVIGVRLGLAVRFAFVRQNPFLISAFLQTCLGQPAFYFFRVRVALLVENPQALCDGRRGHIAGRGLCREQRRKRCCINAVSAPHHLHSGRRGHPLLYAEKLCDYIRSLGQVLDGCLNHPRAVMRVRGKLRRLQLLLHLVKGFNVFQLPL